LRVDPGLQAKTLFEYLQEREPDRFGEGQLRTLQRRIKNWRALEDPPREVFFAQEHYPGELCQSDVTHCRELGIMIDGQAFPHLIYHFVLSYSNWEPGTISYSETFESLSEGLQNALWELGGVPSEHRSDRMSAAVNSLIDTREFTRAYEALLRHYGLSGQKIQAGEARENGDIEQRHYRFKQAVSQALMMRGSRDFATVAAYDQFLRKLFSKTNSARRERFAEELPQLRSLPDRRLDSVRRERVRVSPGSLIHVHRNTYSVHSRLIGEIVEARTSPTPWRSGTATVKWRSCRDCEAVANIASITATSLIGSFASRARLNIIAIAKICFRQVGSNWHMTHCGKNTGRSQAQRNTCRSWRSPRNAVTLIGGHDSRAARPARSFERRCCRESYQGRRTVTADNG
jgi:hypothetical protein